MGKDTTHIPSEDRYLESVMESYNVVRKKTAQEQQRGQMDLTGTLQKRKSKCLINIGKAAQSYSSLKK